MINRIYRESLLLLLISAIAVHFAFGAKPALSVVAGGLLSVVNLGGMRRGLEGFLGTKRSALKLMVFGVLRLGIVSAVIIILAATKKANLIGIAGGFVIVTIITVVEGYRESLRFKKANTYDTGGSDDRA